MPHLLYSSNEMYSSTDLIRKSKTIFNKILSKEIDKAIILRDGKPSFMLLNFDKYEKIMAEYDILKANSNANNNTHKLTKEKVIKKNQKIKKEPIVTQIKSSQVIPPTPIYVEENNIEQEKEVIKPQEEIIEEKVQEGIEVLNDLDFDDEFKKEVEEKVRLRKIQEVKQEAKEEMTKIQIPPKTKPELKEFWA